MSQETFIHNQNASSLEEEESEEEIPWSDLNKLCSRTFILFFILAFFFITSAYLLEAPEVLEHLSTYILNRNEILVSAMSSTASN